MWLFSDRDAEIERLRGAARIAQYLGELGLGAGIAGRCHPRRAAGPRRSR